MPTQSPLDFAWLADAPLFIDAAQIERLYDAIVRPTSLEGATEFSVSASGETTLTAKGSAEGKLEFSGGFFQRIIGMKGEVKAGGEVGTASKTGTADNHKTQWLPIRTPQRQLERLLFTYLQYEPDRLLSVTSANCATLFDPAVNQKSPRALVVLDLPAAAGGGGPKLIPMAAELDKGGIKLLYQDLRVALAPPGQPDATAAPTAKTASQVQSDIWLGVLDRFDPWKAMKVLEDAVGDGRIRWIDFRLPVKADTTEEEQTVHLHFVAGTAFDTGVFGYNFIQRGFRYGARIVATLKAGADLNVLAVYEK